MAIKDMKGTVVKDRATMTGMMNTSPKKIDPPNLSGMEKLFGSPSSRADELPTETPSPKEDKLPTETPSPKEDKLPTETTSPSNLSERLQNLPDEEKALLVQVLSPSVKKVLSKVAPELNPLLDAAPVTEENVIIPISVAKNFANKNYGGQGEEQSIVSFLNDLQDSASAQTNQMDNQSVPPDTQMAMADTPESGVDTDQLDSDVIDEEDISESVEEAVASV
jgi:hypothetical protein